MRYLIFALIFAGCGDTIIVQEPADACVVCTTIRTFCEDDAGRFFECVTPIVRQCLQWIDGVCMDDGAACQVTCGEGSGL